MSEFRLPLQPSLHELCMYSLNHIYSYDTVLTDMITSNFSARPMPHPVQSIAEVHLMSSCTLFPRFFIVQCVVPVPHSLHAIQSLCF